MQDIPIQVILDLKLTSPGGTKSILLNIGNGYNSYTSESGGFDNLSILSNDFMVKIVEEIGVLAIVDGYTMLILIMRVWIMGR